MPEKKVTDAIQFRRSVRIFDPKKEIDPKIVKDCILMESWLLIVVIYNCGNSII